MKKRTHFLMAALLAVVTMCFVGCKGPDDLHVNTQDVWFGLEAGSKPLKLRPTVNGPLPRTTMQLGIQLLPRQGKKTAPLP